MQNHRSIIHKIISPNLGYPCFIHMQKGTFKAIVEVRKRYEKGRFGRKHISREEELLKERIFLAATDKSETLEIEVSDAERIKPKAVRDYRMQNSFRYLYEYYELKLRLKKSATFSGRFKLFNIICGSITNMHAACIHSHEWKDFCFAHITDLHIATRWDSLESDFGRLFSKMDIRTKEFFRKPEFYNMYDTSRDAFTNNFINPNTNLKEFIKKANLLVRQNRLDCIVITGDIVDFAFEDILDTKAEKGRCKNWEYFVSMILGIAHGSEELKVPIITIPGNHDYRMSPYRLVWHGLNRLGINTQLQNNYFHKGKEAKRIKYIIEDVFSMIVPLRQNPSLRFYVNNINPFLSFSVSFGKTHFVMMDTGHEHFSYFRNYFSLRFINMLYSLPYIRDASMVNGFEKRQIKFLRTQLRKFTEDDNLMLFFHAPLFNTFYRYTESNPEQEYELVMKIPKINENDPTTIVERKSIAFENMLRKRNLSIESVFKNQLPIIDLCLKVAFKVIVFSGHRHINMDYKLERKTRAVKIKDYSAELENRPFSSANNPFFLITTSLGMIDFLDVFRSLPSYRHINIKDNEVDSVNTVQLDTRPYYLIQPHVVYTRQNLSEKKGNFLLRISLNQSEKLRKELNGKKLYHTVSIKFSCGYLFSFYDLKLPISLAGKKGVAKSSETKLFFEKESPYNRPVAVKVFNFLLDRTDTISFNIGRLKKSINIHAPGIELYFESFVKEKNGKLNSLGIIHYPLRIKL